jgi:hypothetical protein
MCCPSSPPRQGEATVFTLRPAQEADAATVTELINRDYGEPATVEQVRARIIAASDSRQEQKRLDSERHTPLFRPPE